MRTKEELRAEIKALVSEYASIEYKDKLFLPDETPVPVSGKVIGETELQNMVDASLDGWLPLGASMSY